MFFLPRHLIVVQRPKRKQLHKWARSPKAHLTRRSPLPSNDFADLHDGRDVGIVGDVRADLRPVGT